MKRAAEPEIDGVAEPVSRFVFIFWDFETTDKKPTQCAPVSWGAIACLYHGGEWSVLGKFNEFMDYDRKAFKMKEDAEYIHKISAASVKGKPMFPEIADRFTKFCNHHCKEGMSVIMMAHNGMGFDLQVMFCTMIRYGMDIDKFFKSTRVHGFVDSLPLLRKIMNAHRLGPDEERPMTEIYLADTDERKIVPLMMEDSLTPLTSSGRPSRALGHIYKTHCGGNELEGAHDALIDAIAMYDIFRSKHLSKYVTMNQLFDKRLAYKTLEPCLKEIRRRIGPKYKLLEAQIKQTIKVEKRADGVAYYVVTREEDTGKEFTCYKCVAVIESGATHECEVS